MTLTLGAFSASPVLGVFSVNADEISTQASSTNTNENVTIKKATEAILFSNALKANDSRNTSLNQYNSDGSFIKELLDSDKNVLATEITNLDTDEKTTVTRTNTDVIVEKAVKSINGGYDIAVESYKLLQVRDVASLDNNSKDDLQRVYYSAGTYTNLAVGRNLFASLTNLGVSAVVSFTAGVFGIGTAEADFLLEYMGAKGLPTGTALAKVLDTNGNGWIGLHKRNVYKASGNVGFIGVQHKTN